MALDIQVRLLCNRAISLAEQGCLDDAHSALHEAARLSSENAPLVGLVEAALCRVCFLAGDLPIAAQHGREAVRLLERHGSAAEAAGAVIGLGTVQGAAGKYLEALNLFNKALALLHGSGDRRLLALARWGLGSALGHLERHHEARDSLAIAEQKAEDVLSLVEQGKLETSLGVACLQCGDHSHAETALKRALQAFETVGRAELIADVHNALGGLYAALGNGAAARGSYEQALAVLAGQPAPQLAEAYYELARLEITEGRPSEAVKRAQAALGVARALGSEIEIGRSMLALGQAFLSLEGYSAAIPCLQQALKILDEKGLKLSAVVADDMLKFAERRCRACGGSVPCTPSS